MKNLANDISKGKNLEINLPKYGQKMMDIYYRYSSVRLAMNYYTYREMIEEDSVDKNDKLVEAFLDVVNTAITDKPMGEELEAYVKKIDDIRNDIIKIMKGYISLVDIFNIYEYVLNRVEYRFKDASHVAVKEDDVFTNELIAYILAGNDNANTNIKISEAVRQLPFRMTKARFYEILKEGLKVYKDSEISSVDDYIYMISSAAMVYTDEYADKISDDINEIIRAFENADFAELTEDSYNVLKDKLNYATDYVQTAVDHYTLLCELVNDVYVILLSSPYADTSCQEREILLKIIDNSDDGSAEEALVLLEGRQERLYESFYSMEYVVDEVLLKESNLIESLMLKAVYNSLKLIGVLESGSSFVEFNKDIDHNIAGEDYILLKYEKLKEELTEFFKNHNKLVNRAVMAHVIAALPVFFNNVEEIKSYVYSSINSCSDIAEKTAVMEIFGILMEEEGFGVVS